MPYQQVVTNPLLHQVGGEGTNIYRETPLSGAEATNPEQGGAGTEGVDRQLTPRVSNPDYTPSKEPMTATQVVEYFKNVAPNPNTGIYETGFNAYTSGGVPIFIFAPTRLASKDAAQVQAEIDRVKRDYYEGDQGGGGIGEEIESVVSAPVGGVQTEPPEGAKTAPGAKAPEGGGWYQGVGGYWHPTAMPPSGQEVSFEPGSAYEKQQLALAEKMKPEFAALWREGVRTGDFSKYQSAVQIAQGEGKEQWSHPLADQNAVDRDIQAWAKDNNVPLDEARQRFIDYLTNPTKFDNVQEKIRGLREVAVKHDLYGTGQIPFVATSEKGEQALSLLTPKQVRKLSGLKDEKLFNAMQEMGLYPADYTWAAAGGKGGILTGEQVDLLTSSAKERRVWEQKTKAEEPELYKVYLGVVTKTGDYDKGFEAYNETKLANWEKNILSQMPKEYQEAYKAKDTKLLAQLEAQYVKDQEDFETSLKANTPELYKIYKEQGYDAYRKAFEANHIKLQDSQGNNILIPLESTKDKDGNIIQLGWNDWPEKYQTIAEQENFNKALEAVNADNKEYEVFQAKIASREIIALPDGKYIDKTVFNKQPQGAQQILMSEGFSGYFAANDMYESVGKQLDTKKQEIIEEWLVKNPYPGFVKSFGFSKSEWGNPDKNLNLRASTIGEIGQARVSIVSSLSPSDRKLYEQGVEQFAKGLAVNTLAFIAPPAKALLPEYTISDISGAEWALTGVNIALIASGFAPGAIMGSIASKGIITGLSTTGAGIIGYETAKNWNELNTTQKVIGVGGTLLYALPALTTIARGTKFSSVKVPTKVGELVDTTGKPLTLETTTWRGLSVFDNPIIGKSDGKWVIGARNITLPEARLILDGYHPGLMLETKVFVNPKALRAAGFSDIQIDYLTNSLKSRNLFAGKKSPYLSKEALIESTERLDANDISVLMSQFNKYNKSIKQVDMLYGSPTIKAQTAPELRSWRKIHDWDISTKMSQAETEAFAQDTLKQLQKLGKGEYKIDPKNPTHILKKIDGEWKGIADIHSHYEIPGLSSEIPSSKLDATNTYSYGRMIAEPSITVKYPGIGKIDIMSLSESGVRKADTILRVRQTETGTAFRPPERGISQPGVPKDAADFYIVLRTFKGEKIAEDWLSSWAKSMGYTQEQLAKVLPNIRNAMIEVASQTPSNLIGYRFTPSTAATSGASPTITIHIPSSLAASVSDNIARQISTPINPYKLTPEITSSISMAIPEMTSKMTSANISQIVSSKLPSLSSKIRSEISSSIAKAASPLIDKSASPVTISSAVSKALSPYVSKGVISPSASTTISQSVSTSLSPSPSIPTSPYPSPSVSPSPSPSLSPSPSPSPVLTPEPKPKPEPVPKPLPRIRTEVSEAKLGKRSYEGAVAWAQGALRRKGGKLETQYIVWSYPYTQEHIEYFPEGKVPVGVKVVPNISSAKETIQQFRGKLPPSQAQVADIGAFLATIDKPTPEPGGKGEIKFTRDNPEALKKIALGTTIKQLLTEAYPAKVPKETADRILAKKLSNSTPAIIANELKQVNITNARKKEVLAKLPDRERQQVEVILSNTKVEAPTRNLPRAFYQPEPLRRKKTKAKTTKKKAVNNITKIPAQIWGMPL